MQLRLNPAHTLCQPSRNLVFATFGTGYGGQVLDLSDRPAHGVIVHGGVAQGVIRTLGSAVPLGFPSDYQSLAVRTTQNNARADFGNALKVWNLTQSFTVSVWVRTHGASNPYQFGTESPNNMGSGGGWCLQVRANGVTCFFAEGARYTNATMPVGQFHHVVLTFGATGPTAVYINGAEVAHSGNTPAAFSAGSTFWIGNFDSYIALSDIGPVMVWGSVLPADDIALLYRDTWGMVSPVNSSGLVTWTGATPVAVHLITIRSTNATGNGDGPQMATQFAKSQFRRPTCPRQ